MRLYNENDDGKDDQHHTQTEKGETEDGATTGNGATGTDTTAEVKAVPKSLRRVPLLFARGAAERAAVSQNGAARLSNLLGELDRLKKSKTLKSS